MKLCRDTAHFVTGRRLLLVMVASGIVGSVLLLSARAASSTASLQPEDAALSGNVIAAADTTASGLKAVQFKSVTSSRPSAGGYFQIVAPGNFSGLPPDTQAAAMVHHSSWEPRSQNATANHAVPPSSFTSAGYSGMINHAQLFGRVTGNYTGTTDEIIQWTAAKWGLSDEIIRGEAVAESSWYQNAKDSSGNPIAGEGYGDFGNCGGSPPPSGYGVNGPASFGIMQVKWCAMKDASAPGYDGWPYSETSTAYDLDFYGAVIRGCYEGWDTWLGGTYQAGDMWGCIGRWYAGEWYSAGANSYITAVQSYYNSKPWLSW
jgi:hypothetical protein